MRVGHTPGLCKKTDEPIVSRFLGPSSHGLDGMHISATWRIRSNDPRTAAMRLYHWFSTITCLAKLLVNSRFD